jgi:hypothetical protein
MQIKNNAFLRVTSMQPSWPPANSIETQARNSVSARILLVPKKLLERFSFSIILKSQTTLQRECSHDFVEEHSLGVEIRLGTAQGNMEIVLKCNSHFMKSTLIKVRIGIQRDMNQIFNHSSEKHLIKPRVNRVRLRKSRAWRRLEDTRFKDTEKETLSRRL